MKSAKAITPDMVVEMVRVDKLVLDTRNPRTIDRNAFADLKRNLETNGFVEPIVCNRRTGLIVGGHMRTLAARDLGFITVPVFWVDLSDRKAVALNLRLNKLSGQWDDAKLTELLSGLDAELLGLTGFNDEELAAMNADPFDDDDPAKTPATTPRVKRYTLEELATLAADYHPRQQAAITDFLEWCRDRQ